VLSSLSFTPEFRAKLVALPKGALDEWFATLAARAPADAIVADANDSVTPLLREVARACRAPLAAMIEKRLGPFDPRHLRALVDVPRERFVREGDRARSADDTPLTLDDAGLATISAPHAYLLTYRLLALAPGDRLMELGAGSGYGAALASYIVGSEGAVYTTEIDSALAAWAGRLLAGNANVEAMAGDAMDPAWSMHGAPKVCATFAVGEIPDAWLDALPRGGVLVAPVGLEGAEQRLVRVRRDGDRFFESDHGAVRYVANRSERR
jgi:protein-L-isoaspartate(D-aspartate) O-methyltransferase